MKTQSEPSPFSHPLGRLSGRGATLFSALTLQLLLKPSSEDYSVTSEDH